ncbi:hypothetical protein FVEG_06921 [Fusarium verticillioides 7600]|uniref:Uncharacterized protein n=1 Tax=Gibberella moniliformis (strain M3125 / FGSC 7600) TaxID=334819 RepID=W7MFW7_GIBM7|nr:hypothetical protein FVEG_06921 [Fusarium verticillioides 7600]EWG46415.1 hypothetical protein FVEG_06921 [Fusarium verticillioides 7600]
MCLVIRNQSSVDYYHQEISEEGQGPLAMMSTFRKKLKVLTGPLNKRYGRGVEMVIDSALGARLMVVNCP